MSEFSEALKRSRFVHCHQGKEKIAGSICTIEAGMPFTFEFNNGICAVYDEKGHVWVLPERVFTDAMAIALFGTRYHSRWEYGGKKLERDAYVPHSNDGGAWAERTFPKK